MPFDSAVSTIEIVAKKRGRPSGTAKASRKTPIGTKQTAIYKRMSEKFAARGWTRTFIQEQLLLDQNVASDAMSELVKQSIMRGFAEFVVATRGMIETFSDIFSQQNVVVSTVANGRTATVLELFSLYSLKEIEDNGISAEKMIQQLQVPSHTRQYATKFARIYDDIMFIWDLFNELPTNQHANVAEKIIGYLKKNDNKFERKNGFVTTPFKLVREMLGKLSFKDGDTFLDPACGRGTFLLVALQKNPNIKVYGIDKDAGKAFICAALISPQNFIVDNIYIGDTLTLSESDLEGIFKMAKKSKKLFDVVVGNPPYNTPRSATKTADLYPDFINLGNKLSESVCMVTPSKWFSKNKKLCDNMVNNYGLVDITTLDPKVFEDISLMGGLSYFLLQDGYNSNTSVDGVDVDLKERLKKYGSISSTHDESIDRAIELVELHGNLFSYYRGQMTFNVMSNHATVEKDGIPCLFSRQNGGMKMVENKALKNLDLIDKWKVVFPEANGTMNDDLSHIPPLVRLLAPGSIVSQSFVFFAFDTQEEQIAFHKFITSPVVLRIIAKCKVTQHFSFDTFRFVPDIRDASLLNPPMQQAAE